jgi:hypothetical protein
MPCDSTTSGPSPVTSYAIRGAPLMSRNSVMSPSMRLSMLSTKLTLIAYYFKKAAITHLDREQLNDHDM